MLRKNFLFEKSCNFADITIEYAGICNMKQLETTPRVGRVGLPNDAFPESVSVDCSRWKRELGGRMKVSQRKIIGTLGEIWKCAKNNTRRPHSRALITKVGVIVS